MNYYRKKREWTAWIEARKAGYAGKLVWSDEEGYKAYKEAIDDYSGTKRLLRFAR